VLPKESSDSTIVGSLAESYSVREVYEKARRRADPYSAPHVHFRSLANGNRRHAIEFLESFGPLLVQDQRKIVGVELTAFWDEQRRFSLVSRLRESRDDARELRKGLEEYLNFAAYPRETEAEMSEAPARFAKASAGIKQQLRSMTAEQMSRIRELSGNKERTGLPVNSKPNLNDLVAWEELEQAHNPSQKVHGPVDRHPPTHDAEQFLHWLAVGEDPRAMARLFLKENIEFYTEGVRFRWEAGLGRDADKFYPRRQFDSLLAAIWDLLAQDTAGVSWRICPNDGNIFYPPRADRIFCTTAEQVKWSKEQYEKARKRKRQQKSRSRGRIKKC